MFCGYEHSQSLCMTLDGWYGRQVKKQKEDDRVLAMHLVDL